MDIVDKDNWLERLQMEGDVQGAALDELRNLLVRGLNASFRNLSDSQLQSEDIAQDALIIILKKLDTFEGRSKFTTWAMSIAVRLAISATRRKRFKDVSMDAFAEDGMRMDIAEADERPVGNELEREVVLTKLQALIQSNLTAKQRSATMALLNGMPVEVIAEKTGSNRNAIYKLIHDARSKLREGFEQAGFIADDINAIFA